MIYQIPIQNYTVAIGNKMPAYTRNEDAWIFCTGIAPGEPHTKLQLTIHFDTSGQSLPPNATVGSGSIDTEEGGRPSHDFELVNADIYVKADHYPWFLDALRNEKCDAWLYLGDGETPSSNRIHFTSRAGWGQPDQ